MSGIAFVGSTLPARIVAQKARTGEISAVLTSAPSLEPSFQYLRQQTPGLSVGSLPHTPIRQALSLLFILLKAKLSNRNIYIFHECCWPVMDLMIWLLHPTGWFLPQTNMLSCTRLPDGEALGILRQKKFGRILPRSVLRLFWVYAYLNDGGEKTEYMPVLRRYPSSIKCGDESAVKSANSLAYSLGSESDAVLFLVGTDSVRSDALRDMYKALIDVARHSGCRVEVKDHPNKDVRINLAVQGVGVDLLDPSLPAEFLDRKYRYVVGVGSASLASFDRRAISIIDILDEMEDEVKILRKRYLLSLNPNIIFLTSIKHFESIIKMSSGAAENVFSNKL